MTRASEIGILFLLRYSKSVPPKVFPFSNKKPYNKAPALFFAIFGIIPNEFLAEMAKNEGQSKKLALK